MRNSHFVHPDPETEGNQSTGKQEHFTDLLKPSRNQSERRYCIHHTAHNMRSLILIVHIVHTQGKGGGTVTSQLLQRPTKQY
uniref:Uncharacterized protein n=1 Tax=Anguilla anguilla TaxID=7936 RepID=A0A0E9V9Q7_ANGAN